MVRYLGYVIELGGVRVYHSGDCLWWPGQERVLRDLGVHVALLPINGRDPIREAENIVGNMDHREAALLAAAAGVELLVPMHWDMFDGNRGFPDQLVAVIERLGLDVPTFVPRHMRPFRFVSAGMEG
jgi:L-ascorbate metabolism protein UlaG (beta-lactamase superfamily)